MKTKFIDKALFLPEKKVLVIADLHFGYEGMLAESGVLIPRFQFKQVIFDLEKIFEKVGKVKEVIILGDLKHEFGQISSQEWKDVLSFLDFLKKKVKKIVLIKGNHDNYLINVVKKKGIKLRDFYVKGDVCFVHGHKSFPKCMAKRIRVLIMGHKHPAITIREDVKAETYKCFLVGRFRGKEVIVLPSFFPLVEGSDVFIEDTNLAFDFKLKNFNVYVVGDEVYEFGKVKDVGKLSG